ncbi:hypothetical protein [Alkalicoccobacillus gibsonii]|uniref:hypothetical protein n=1 Tax=Alkalicoccobacillus gibsonii TaxID=79881 RepID=UPI00193288A5|nr:hypothetical protein [Alkalicoccobacillus gibsonii]MBM0066858.1 hypothetical protein [Alkalicoccobacillus gibsonii]
MDLPTIQTNIWDAVLAVPVVLIVTELIKWITRIPHKYIPTVATILGVLISVFYSHRHDLPAGLFMGFFYGNAAVGTYAGMKTALTAYRKSNVSYD